jgi:hypothetical protein
MSLIKKAAAAAAICLLFASVGFAFEGGSGYGDAEAALKELLALTQINF